MSILHCPVCGTAFDHEHSPAMPFCSVRCQQIDLGRWLNEENSLPRAPDPEDDETPEDDWSN